MHTKIKFPRAAAMKVAAELCRCLEHETELLIVAGSLRRRKQEVGDVEILYIPRFGVQADPADLFGKAMDVNLVDFNLERLLKHGIIAKRPKANGSFTWGDENKLAIHVASGIPVDFFQARRANWWNLLVCRTGSKENNAAICNAAIRKSWKWQPYGPGFEDRLTGRQVYRVDSERDVFNAVGLVYKEPWER
jgi:DNA polymerase/3'-5' exonuclease PolX